MTTWKSIPGCKGYQANKDGKIRSCHGFGYGYKELHGLQANFFGGGGKPKRESIHRVIWRTFNGEVPKGYAVRHKNGDKQDNRLSNLYLSRRAEAAKDNPNFRKPGHPVTHLDEFGETICVYKTIREAAAENFLSPSGLSNRIRHGIKQEDGTRFIFAEG